MSHATVVAATLPSINGSYASLPVVIPELTPSANISAIARASGRRRRDNGSRGLGCITWRQTAGCMADGPLEPDFDAACNVTIVAGRSGFCLCEGHQRAASVDCGHRPHSCDAACRQQRQRLLVREDDRILDDAQVVSALGYSALMAFGDRAAAAALSHRMLRLAADGHGSPGLATQDAVGITMSTGKGKVKSRGKGKGRRRWRGTSAGADTGTDMGLVPLLLYQTIDRLDRSGVGGVWRASEAAQSHLRYTLHDDVVGQQYLNRSWGPRFARAFGQLALGPIRSDFLRLAYVAEHGGFYADADLCPGANGTLSRLRAFGAPLVIVRSAFGGELLNAFFGATPRHPALQPLVWAALRHIERGDRGYSKLAPTAVAGPQLMGPLLHAHPQLALNENMTGTAYHPEDPGLQLVSCAGLIKDWEKWQSRPGFWHRKEASRYEYARAPIVETKWTDTAR